MANAAATKIATPHRLPWTHNIHAAKRALERMNPTWGISTG